MTMTRRQKEEVELAPPQAWVENSRLKTAVQVVEY